MSASRAQWRSGLCQPWRKFHDRRGSKLTPSEVAWRETFAAAKPGPELGAGGCVYTNARRAVQLWREARECANDIKRMRPERHNALRPRAGIAWTLTKKRNNTSVFSRTHQVRTTWSPPEARRLKASDFSARALSRVPIWGRPRRRTRPRRKVLLNSSQLRGEEARGGGSIKALRDGGRGTERGSRVHDDAWRHDADG